MARLLFSLVLAFLVMMGSVSAQSAPNVVWSGKFDHFQVKQILTSLTGNISEEEITITGAEGIKPKSLHGISIFHHTGFWNDATIRSGILPLTNQPGKWFHGWGRWYSPDPMGQSKLLNELLFVEYWGLQDGSLFVCAVQGQALMTNGGHAWEYWQFSGSACPAGLPQWMLLEGAYTHCGGGSDGLIYPMGKQFSYRASFGMSDRDVVTYPIFETRPNFPSRPNPAGKTLCHLDWFIRNVGFVAMRVGEVVTPQVVQITGADSLQRALGIKAEEFKPLNEILEFHKVDVGWEPSIAPITSAHGTKRSLFYWTDGLKGVWQPEVGTNIGGKSAAVPDKIVKFELKAKDENVTFNKPDPKKPGEVFQNFSGEYTIINMVVRGSPHALVLSNVPTTQGAFDKATNTIARGGTGATSKNGKSTWREALGLKFYQVGSFWDTAKWEFKSPHAAAPLSMNAVMWSWLKGPDIQLIKEMESMTFPAHPDLKGSSLPFKEVK